MPQAYLKIMLVRLLLVSIGCSARGSAIPSKGWMHQQQFSVKASARWVLGALGSLGQETTSNIVP